jgi:hypothetical protein
MNRLMGWFLHVEAGILPASKAASCRPAESRLTGRQGWPPPRYFDESSIQPRSVASAFSSNEEEFPCN